MNDVKNEPTTEHDIYISLGLEHPMKPSDCRKLIDLLVVDNFELVSWGTHTKDEWIDVVNECQEKVEEEIEKKEFYQSEHQNAINRNARLIQEKNKLSTEIESLKAITELAVKGLKEAELNYMGRASYESSINTIQEMLKPIRSTLSEIERLIKEK